MLRDWAKNFALIIGAMIAIVAFVGPFVLILVFIPFPLCMFVYLIYSAFICSGLWTVSGKFPQ